MGYFQDRQRWAGYLLNGCVVVTIAISLLCFMPGLLLFFAFLEKKYAYGLPIKLYLPMLFLLLVFPLADASSSFHFSRDEGLIFRFLAFKKFKAQKNALIFLNPFSLFVYTPFLYLKHIAIRSIVAIRFIVRFTKKFHHKLLQ